MKLSGPVAVLGAGIMGSSTALHLTRLGVPVTLFDRENAPFRGASRWNEGKIHLGFLYAADPTLATTRAVLDGGLAFKDEVELLTGTTIGSVTPVDDLYLVHRDSVTTAEQAGAYFEAVAELVRNHPGAPRYLADVSRGGVRAVKPSELERLCDPEVVVAGYRVPERSVDTNVVADSFVRALEADERIELALDRCVTAVSATGDDPAGPWYVHTGDERHGPFGGVVNALWEGRPRIDLSAGHHPDAAEQHRYRVSLFVRTAEPLDVPSVVLAVGPFGDVKNYGGTDLYLSWYTAGLLARSESIDPPPVPQLDRHDRGQIASTVFAELGRVLPWIGAVEAAAVDVRVEGGWVYSQGRGTLDDPRASVHRRDRLGISRLGAYFSVDTGKYSVAPTLARRLAAIITGC